MAEKEFIERGQVVNALGHRIQELTNESFVRGMNEALSIAEEFVRSIPAADVVPVVHCKNCEYNNECSVQDFGEMHQNDFCSRGKRRSDNG